MINKKEQKLEIMEAKNLILEQKELIKKLQKTVDEAFLIHNSTYESADSNDALFAAYDALDAALEKINNK